MKTTSLFYYIKSGELTHICFNNKKLEFHFYFVTRINRLLLANISLSNKLDLKSRVVEI